MSSLRLSIFSLLPVVGVALLTAACGAPLAVTAGGYAADGTLMVASDKSSSDHIASIVSKKDCALWRAFRGGDVCKDRDGAKDPYAVDYDEPQRSVSEDGVKYGPPLRSSGDAPAASWDAAAYKPAAAPAGPATAVVDASPAPAPAATAAPKRKKAKVTRAPKKPSRGPAAPAA